MGESVLTKTSFVPDNLVIEQGEDLEITIPSGQGVLVRGTLMGKVTKEVGTPVVVGTGNGTAGSITMGLLAKIGSYLLTCIRALVEGRVAPTTGTKTGTGNGTMTSVTAGSGAKKGTYKMTCIDATVSGSEVFKVVNPQGDRLDDATVGVAYTSDEINFTITDGSTDFIVGDYFTVAVAEGGVFQVRDPEGNLLPDATVAAAYTNPQINFTISDGSTDWVEGDTITIPIEEPSSETYLKALAAAVDGSQEPENMVILASDCDATSEARERIGYDTGVYNENKITFGTGLTADKVRKGLQSKGLILRAALTNV